MRMRMRRMRMKRHQPHQEGSEALKQSFIILPLTHTSVCFGECV